ncbi:IclR family transcriptional regulator [Kosmotoga arenicorallina]|uniref:IclR family transcriptional regulator n=1 Tax=Kosmotoga arenicorallina TaxID=688066 RepID=UPI001F26A65C|nr:IclR family transcriptional regulator [Kosmotoga arenicorallina]
MIHLQSLERFISILESFSAEHPELSLGELVEKTNLPKPTVYRIVEAMVKYNILSKNKKTMRYKVGVKLFELGSIYLASMELRDIAFPYLDWLQRQTGESIHLGILDGNEVVSIEGLESAHSLRLKVWIGKRAPVHCTAIGKAILAFLPSEEQNEILSEISLESFTKSTIVSMEELEIELKKVKNEGISKDLGEHEDGIHCIGAPIFDRKGNVVASISVSGPAVRMTEEKMKKYKPLLLKAANGISKKLGYSS